MCTINGIVTQVLKEMIRLVLDVSGQKPMKNCLEISIVMFGQPMDSQEYQQKALL